MEIGNQQALDAWAACTSRPENTLGSVYGTAETLLDVFGDPVIAASAEGCDLDLDELLTGANNTLYLYAPASEQERLRPLFELLVSRGDLQGRAAGRRPTRRDARPPVVRVPGRGRQLRRHQEAPPAGHHRPRPGHPAADHLARRGPAPAPLRPPGLDRPQRPPGQAAPQSARPTRPPSSSPASWSATRPSPRPRRPPAATAAPPSPSRRPTGGCCRRRRCGSSSPGGPCWCMGICRRCGSGCGPGSAPAAWSRWPWRWMPRCRTRPWPSTTSPPSSRSVRRARMGRWPPDGHLPGRPGRPRGLRRPAPPRRPAGRRGVDLRHPRVHRLCGRLRVRLAGHR